MSQTIRTDSSRSPGGWRWGALLLAAAGILIGPAASQAQLDICGCTGAPTSLGAFDTTDPASYPPGTIADYSSITIPLPPDGILIFDSMSITTNEFGGGATLQFEPNAANTPVTLLVKGDVTISGAQVNLDGHPGTAGSFGQAGVGGQGGPGGFRGGDGAYQLVTLASDGGAGFGPAGGAAGTASPLAPGLDGTFTGSLDLLPLVGGSGGGGGASSAVDTECSGGGGGGGGGAILIAANGTITLSGYVSAVGGYAGYVSPSIPCASSGGQGSGGAIRLVANAIGGTGFVQAGRIRMESFTNTLPGQNTTPAASRALVPGPLVNPLTPTVAFTAVNGETQSLANGQPISELPQGVFGVVDVILPAPGVTTFDLATSGVPSGTTLEVTAKPRLGGGPVATTTVLDPASCNGAGDCVAAVAFDLPAGAYVLEAQATFETP